MYQQAFTITADTVGRLRGPESKRGAGENTASNRHVTKVTVVLQNCANRKPAPVSVRQI